MAPTAVNRTIEPAGRPEGNASQLLPAVVVIAAVLYFAREILVPLAFAVLLSFVLAPLLRRLQKWRLPRSVAVPVVVILAFSIVLGLGAMVATQVTSLAADLPRYQVTIRQKVQDLRSLTESQGAFGRAAAMLESLSKDLKGDGKTQQAPAPSPSQRANPAPAAPAQTDKPADPIPVEVHQPEASPLETIRDVLGPLVHPVATTGLIIIFVVFILAQREDLRNRLIRLAGSHDIQRTTAAIDDAAHRLSRLYLVQLALNGGFGVVIGTGLWLIGVPSPVLWGVLAAVLRFVPYVGSIMAALFPLVLAMAVDPGWSMVLWTALLFAIVEPIVGHAIEPVVQGHSTGLSPVAVVISAAFWTWLWGPVGLVLATPLTVCLVVLGRHVEKLQSLDVMLGDRPPLAPEEIFYQRMLAGDPQEAAEQAEAYLEDHSIVEYYDGIGLGGLRLAVADHARGALDETRLACMRSSVQELVEELQEDEEGWLDRLRGPRETDVPDEDGLESGLVVAPEALAEEWRSEHPVLCVAGRSALDEAGSRMLAHALSAHGLGARAESAEFLSPARLFRFDPAGVRMVCVSFADLRGEGSMRYAVRRLRRKLPEAFIAVCYWSADTETDSEELRRATGADAVATSIGGALALARDVALSGRRGEHRDRAEIVAARPPLAQTA